MKVDLPDSPVPIYKKGKQLINASKEQNHFTQQQRRALRNKLVWHYEEKLKQEKRNKDERERERFGCLALQ